MTIIISRKVYSRKTHKCWEYWTQSNLC